MANFESPNPVIPLPIALLHPADAGTLAVGRRAPHRGCQLIWDGWHERACGARGAAAPSDQRFHTGRQPPACFGQNSGRSRSGDNAPRRLALESPRGVTRRRRLHASGRPASLPSSPVRGLSFRRGGRRRTPPALGEASRLASTKPASAPLPSCSPGRVRNTSGWHAAYTNGNLSSAIASIAVRLCSRTSSVATSARFSSRRPRTHTSRRNESLPKLGGRSPASSQLRWRLQSCSRPGASSPPHVSATALASLPPRAWPASSHSKTG